MLLRVSGGSRKMTVSRFHKKLLKKVKKSVQENKIWLAMPMSVDFTHMFSELLY